MSAGLLAEFDTFYQAPPPANHTQTSGASTHDFQNGIPTISAHVEASFVNWNGPPTDVRSLSGLKATGNVSDYEESNNSHQAWQAPASEGDIWNTFEDTRSGQRVVNQRNGLPETEHEGMTNAHGGMADKSTQAYRVNGGRRTQAANTLHNEGPVAAQVSKYVASSRPQGSSRYPKVPRDVNVLFDAEEDQEDDFGDFESAQESATSTPHLDENRAVMAQQIPGYFPDFHAFSASSSSPASATQSNVKTFPLPYTAPMPQTTQMDYLNHSEARELGRRSVVSAAKFPRRAAQIAAAHEPLSTEPLRFEAFPSSSDSPTSDTFPTNIPPPALLLTLFPPILNLATTQLFEPLAGQSHSIATREAILEHPETQTFLAAYLAVIGVLARIIAGRKLRWKRDTLLAQSMRIGPASVSGRSGGMKLTGVDKAESAREEREVAEVMKIWRAQVGRLRSAVTTSTTSHRVPELAETPIVRTAKEEEGGIGSPKACVLCGLKRNERINKVDVDIADSFGEWWLDHWGHRACKSFWGAQKGNLSAR